MFEHRFADDVRAGLKKCTIRKKGKRVTKVGYLMDARIWSGVPYRSKTIKLIESPIVKIQDFEINFIDEVKLGGEVLYDSQIAQIAEADGFKGYDQIDNFIRFFFDRYGFPFYGQLIHWD